MLTTTMTLHEALVDVAREHAERVALISGEERLTYGQLIARVEALATALGGLGIARGNRVASMLLPGWRFAALFFALMRLGAVAVPLDPQAREPRLRHILKEIEPAALVVGQGARLAGDLAAARVLLGEVAPRCRLIGKAPSDGGPDLDGLLAAGAGPPSAPASATADDLAVILYTSGTTGQPKGVMHSHRGLIGPVVASTRLRRMWLQSPSPAQLARMGGLIKRYGLRLLQAAGRPQTMLTAVGGHAIAGIEAMLQALLMGDTLLLMPRFHPLETLRLIEQERVTVLIAPPWRSRFWSACAIWRATISPPCSSVARARRPARPTWRGRCSAWAVRSTSATV